MKNNLPLSKMFMGIGASVFLILIVIAITLYLSQNSTEKGIEERSTIEQDVMLAIINLTGEDVELVDKNHKDGLFQAKSGGKLYQIKYNKSEDYIEFISHKDEVVYDKNSE